MYIRRAITIEAYIKMILNKILNSFPLALSPSRARVDTLSIKLKHQPSRDLHAVSRGDKISTCARESMRQGAGGYAKRAHRHRRRREV